MGKMKEVAIEKEERDEDIGKVIAIFKGKSISKAVTSLQATILFLLSQIKNEEFKEAMKDICVKSLTEQK